MTRPIRFCATLLLFLAACHPRVKSSSDTSASSVATGFTQGPVLYNPGANGTAPGDSYTRVIRLAHQADATANGRLLSTFEFFAAPQFPIYESRDDGRSWTASPISTVSEVQPGFRMAWQPDLFELPQAVGNLPAGAILVAGTSLADNPFRQRLQLYVSLDQGHTWAFRSTIAESDPGLPGGLWEPNVQLSADGRVVVYYSSEQHSGQGFNQLLAHRVSPDGGQTWGGEFFDVAVPGGAMRPGMAVVKRLPSGTYLMSFEYVGSGPGNPAHVKRSADGLDWGNPADPGAIIGAAHGAYIGATPYITWVPAGGPAGMVVASAQNSLGSKYPGPRLLFNTSDGVGPWEEMGPPVMWKGGNDHAGWSQGMIATADGQSILQLVSSDIGGGTNEILYGRATLPSANIVAGGVYTLSNGASGNCIDVNGGSRSAGLVMQQYLCNGMPAQQFRMDPLGNGSYRLTNIASELALTHNETRKSGTKVVQQPAGAGQGFFIKPRADGAFDIVTTGTGLAIDINGGANDLNAPVQLWSPTGATAQGFRFWRIR